jgi:hypothetical protein
MQLHRRVRVRYRLFAGVNNQMRPRQGILDKVLVLYGTLKDLHTTGGFSLVSTSGFLRSSFVLYSPGRTDIGRPKNCM